MEFTQILVTDRGPITEVTLNRPEQRNPLSLTMLSELGEAVRRASGDVIVIGGSGSCFSAGHDLREMLDREAPDYDALFGACSEVMSGLHEAPQPVIAKVHGVATAAGCQLVAACDLAIAAEGSRFATPGVKIGLFCSTPMVALSRAIGRKRALQMLLTGQMIDADTAADWGLVNSVVPPGELDAAVDSMATEIAQASARVVALGKAAFYRQVDVPEVEAYESSCRVMSANALMADAQEGMSAFLDKRPPAWP